jgi:mannose-6-phosphate isomerase-like protein (cupin superfamily)
MLRKSNRPYTDRTLRTRWANASRRLALYDESVYLPDATLAVVEAAAELEGFVTDIGDSSVDNTDYRRVIYTGENMQLVLMSLKPGEEIGSEVHDLSQFLRIEAGSATAVLDGEEHVLAAEDAVIVPEGVTHNLINTGEVDLKLYSIYSPPQHPEGTTHKTKAEADEAEKVEAGALEGVEDLTISDILEAHDQWQEESPEDPEAIHRLVDESWAKKRAKKVDVG